MTDDAMPTADSPAFNEQYAGLVKDAFRQQVARDRAAGADLVERAHDFAERGKPEFVLGYLMATALSESEKREMLAHAFERRADLAERTAAALDAEHHRPFPLIGLEARKDRSMARQVRQGKMIRPYARASKPLGMQ